MEVLKLTSLLIPCFDFFRYKMMSFTLEDEKISIYPYMDTSVCRSGNVITV